MSRVKSLTLSHNGQTKSILIYPGIQRQEVVDVIAAGYNVDARNIKAIRNTVTDQLYSIGDVCNRTDSIRTDMTHELLLSFSQSTDLVPVQEGKSTEVIRKGRLEDLPFSHTDISQLMGIFNRHAPNGVVNEVLFEECFQEFIQQSNFKGPERVRLAGMLQDMFEAFDTDRNGVVDSKEFLSGLTVLCAGNREDKILAAFQLYDANNDGYISFEEMVKYLTSVFTVIYHNSKELFEEHGVAPSELGRVTAEGCFSDADLNHDGKLSFEEFRKWYSEPARTKLNRMADGEAPSDTTLSLESIKKLTGLENFSTEEVFEVFYEATTGDQVDRETFRNCFRHLAERKGAAMSEYSTSLLDSLFDIFDMDKNGYVDFEELASGISVLCKGTRDEKIQAAFALYDTNGDGRISLEEMTTYMSSVFKVLYKSSPETAAAMGVSAEELGEITARQCFEEADLNKDGSLTYEEFKEWYMKPGKPGNLDTAELAAKSDSNWNSLKEVQRLTCLEQYDVNEVIRQFKGFAKSGNYLTRNEFRMCFDRIIASAVGTFENEAEREKCNVLVEKLFDIFDQDGNDRVDFRELTMGLSILCGNRNAIEKIKASFELYDENGDGYISPEEMRRYLCCVFKVIYETVPGTQHRMKGLSPDELANVTTIECFEECDKNHDGVLSFEEFTSWYLSSPDGIAMQDISENLSSWMSLNEVRKITGLENYTVEDVFEEFAKVADREGSLDRSAFNEIFLKLGPASESREDRMKLEMVLDTLFRVFDTDGNGVVDFNELASGVSILCGGDEESKARAAFALYDYDSDGYISLDEMQRYLTSIFKVVYETQPGTKERANGATPDELAAATAEQIFVEADLNGDGKLSLEEFTKWYMQDNETKQLSDRATTWISLKEVQRLTQLNLYTPQQAFEVLAQYADGEGLINKQGFFTAFKRLIAARGNLQEEDKDRTRLILHRLFDIFDADNNGVVDFAEVASGLSILCGGHARMKAKAAFRLYDYDDNGFISLEEMERYLTCIFKIMYETQPGTREQMGGVSPEALAKATTQQAFMEADLNNDGKLSFEEFERWYNAGDAVDETHARKPHAVVSSIPTDEMKRLSIEEIRRLTNLSEYTAVQLFEEFARAAGEDELLDRDSFNRVFEEVVNADAARTESDFLMLSFIMDRLFDLFDSDADGYVDSAELTSGLTVLCGGSRDEKVKAAFALYDANGDGYISLEEMIQYLTSVFKVVYETQPSTVEKTQGATPEELAVVTAEQIFIDADLNNDGRLSLEEFTKWYSQEHVNGHSVEHHRRHHHAPGSGAGAGATHQRPVPSGATLTLAEARRVTRLDRYTPEEAFEILAVGGKDGYLDHAGFKAAFKKLAMRQGPMDGQELAQFNSVIDRLYEVFDVDGNGVVDFTEISSGVSFLCQGDAEKKAQAAFRLYDYNEDGFISLEEMKQYMACVFKVMFELEEGAKARQGNFTPDQLAAATAQQIFQDADLNGDGKLSFAEFQRWYEGDVGKGVSGPADLAANALDINEIRRLTRLNEYSASELFKRFARFANKSKELTRDAFNEVFEEIIDMDAAETEEDYVKLSFIVDRLFDLFDRDKNGFVDFAELSSGLTVLCGGSRDDKLFNAFKIFDENQDGFISLEEMVKYLTSVFTVMYETQPKSRQQMNGVTPEQFALATAQQVFAEYDVNKDNQLSFDEFKAWYTD